MVCVVTYAVAAYLNLPNNSKSHIRFSFMHLTLITGFVVSLILVFQHFYVLCMQEHNLYSLVNSTDKGQA